MYAITLSRQGGTGSPSPIYWDDGSFYSDEEGTTAITSITPPTRTGYTFNGFYTKKSGGTKYIDSSGNFNSTFRALTVTGDFTLYAQWTQVSYKIALDKDGGTGGTDSLYYKIDGGGIYSDADCTTAATAITLPTKSGYTFDGAWSGEGKTGTKYIGRAGNIASAFSSATFTADTTIYCGWNQASYKLTIDADGGTGGTAALYYLIDGGGIYADADCTEQATAITAPTREGYTFGGVYSAQGGSGTKYINSSGNIRSELTSATFSADTTLYAAWTANTYTATFDYQGGTEGETTRTVTYGQAIGTLPTTTKTGATFDGWYLQGAKITATSAWNVASDERIIARWVTLFGDVVDYFGLASATLVPESSDSGDTHQHTCAYNATSEAATTATSGIWRNPRVTYRAAADTTLAVTLGAAFAGEADGTGSDSVMTRSGYMITAVEVHTAVGEAPSVTVTGVANEGYEWDSSQTQRTVTATPAIKTYAISIPISARHRPQNLLSAISGGGDLQELTLVARGDPVVVAEDGMPCASDMTHGRIEVTATTAAYNNETAPTAGTGFVKTAEPQSNSGTGYKTFSVSVRKELT